MPPISAAAAAANVIVRMRVSLMNLSTCLQLDVDLHCLAFPLDEYDSNITRLFCTQGICEVIKIFDLLPIKLDHQVALFQPGLCSRAVVLHIGKQHAF